MRRATREAYIHDTRRELYLLRPRFLGQAEPGHKPRIAHTNVICGELGSFPTAKNAILMAFVSSLE